MQSTQTFSALFSRSLRKKVVLFCQFLFSSYICIVVNPRRDSDCCYTRKDNETLSTGMIEALKQQGFMD